MNQQENAPSAVLNRVSRERKSFMLIDYTKILLNNDYQNFTLQHLIDCYEKLDTQAFVILRDLFSNAMKYKLKIRNARIERNGSLVISGGIGLVEPDTPKSESETEAIIRDIMIKRFDDLKADEAELTEKESAFLACVRSLIDAFPYISPDELYRINELFDHVLLFDKFICPGLKDSKGNLFYPYS